LVAGRDDAGEWQRAEPGCDWVCSAGIFIGELLISQVIFPVRLQPIFTSTMGASYGLGAVIGPLIGGALTTRIGWRW
jgi:MFS family permease